MKKLKILFLTDNFPPESNAPANRTYEHCCEWLKQGAEVTVITCNPNFPKGKLYPGYSNKIYQEESMDGIRVIRVWTYITPNRGTIKRILDYLSFALMSFFASIFIKTDIIIATSPQLFTAVGGYLASVLKRRPWIMEVRDLWPESIQAVDAINNHLILKYLEKLVRFLYKSANCIVVVTDTFKSRISAEGINPDKIVVVKNGVNSQRYHELSIDLQLKYRLGLQDKFVVGYIGTHGLAHNLDFILHCAKHFKEQNTHFLFIGDGAHKERLKAKVEEECIHNVSMLDPVPRDMVPDYINLCDVALVPLKKSDTFKTVIPSKIFENAAMRKPILLGVEGEAQEIIENYRAGLCFEPENELDFIDKLTQLRENPELYLMCQDGCTDLASEFSRQNLAEKMMISMKKTVNGSQKTSNPAKEWIPVALPPEERIEVEI